MKKNIVKLNETQLKNIIVETITNQMRQSMAYEERKKLFNFRNYLTELYDSWWNIAAFADQVDSDWNDSYLTGVLTDEELEDAHKMSERWGKEAMYMLDYIEDLITKFTYRLEGKDIKDVIQWRDDYRKYQEKNNIKTQL